MKFIPLRSILLSSVCVFAMGAGSAFAGAFGLHEQSAEALGAAFAGVSAGAGGLSSMFWNPATLTQSPGIQTSTTLSAIVPYASDTYIASTLPGNGARPSPGAVLNTPVALPASYASYQVNDQLWAGISVNTPFGLSTKNAYGSAAGPWGLTTTIFTADITPELAYKINNWISVGVGLQIMYMEARETSAAVVVPASATPPVNVLKGNSWGVGFTAGVTLTPIEGTEIGLGYRSQVRQGLKGTVAGNTPFPGLIPFTAQVSAPITLPDTVNLGLRQRITPQFTLLAGIEWTNWSRVQSLSVTSTAVATPVPLPAGTLLYFQNLAYRDGWMYSLGGEYKWDQNLTLRAGAAYEVSPITNANRDVRLLDSDRIWLSLGASYKVSSKLKLDVSYAHIFYASGTIAIPAAAAPGLPFSYNGSISAHGDVISVGLTYRWDEPKGAVVAKY